MTPDFPPGLFDNLNWLMYTAILISTFLLLLGVYIILKYGRLWLQAKASKADVSAMSLIGMSLRNVNPVTVVTAQVMAAQAGLTISPKRGMTTSFLEAHYLAGGDVNQVILAIIAANCAGIDLDFERAAAIDLSGRDLAEAVRTSIFPKVIDCPASDVSNQSTRLSAIAKNGVELLARVRVTVRTNLDQLIGGATEETIIARVGQGVVSAIGSMDLHEEALAKPSRISRAVFKQSIQSNTAYEIVSIDIAAIDVGRNIGAGIQVEQAEADTRVARASAEMRRANAIASFAEMSARLTAKKANLLLAQSEIPRAMAQAIKAGQLHSIETNSAVHKPILKFPDSHRRA